MYPLEIQMMKVLNLRIMMEMMKRTCLKMTQPYCPVERENDDPMFYIARLDIGAFVTFALVLELLLVELDNNYYNI
jgi:hypothetical protein